MSGDMQTKEKFRNGVKLTLKCLAALCSAASTITPIFGPVGSIFKAVEKAIPGEDEIVLSKEFEKVNKELKAISQKNEAIIDAIKKQESEFVLSQIEDKLKQLFKVCVEIETADPADIEKKKDYFIKQYRGPQERSLKALYELVNGEHLVFAEPILQLYKTLSNGQRQVMQDLCDHFRYLFSIGLNCHICFLTFTEESDTALERKLNDWNDKLKIVNKKMDDAVNEFS